MTEERGRGGAQESAEPSWIRKQGKKKPATSSPVILAPPTGNAESQTATRLAYYPRRVNVRRCWRWELNPQGPSPTVCDSVAFTSFATPAPIRRRHLLRHERDNQQPSPRPHAVSLAILPGKPFTILSPHLPFCCAHERRKPTVGPRGSYLESVGPTIRRESMVCASNWCETRAQCDSRPRMTERRRRKVVWGLSLAAPRRSSTHAGFTGCAKPRKAKRAATSAPFALLAAHLPDCPS